MRLTGRAPDGGLTEAGKAQVVAAAARSGPGSTTSTWFGVRTAPDHFLGDYPAVKFSGFAHAIPQDLTARACSTSAATAASTRSR
jgi:tRNA (mo5U34)-methyltransferase